MVVVFSEIMIIMLPFLEHSRAFVTQSCYFFLFVLQIYLIIVVCLFVGFGMMNAYCVLILFLFLIGRVLFV